MALSYARSPLSQWECEDHTAVTAVGSPSAAVTPLPSRSQGSDTVGAVAEPRGAGARLADPSIGARVPHTAVTVLSKALRTGPVLLSIPSDGMQEALGCVKCHAQARCAKCTGPLGRMGDGVPRCRWVRCGGGRLALPALRLRAHARDTGWRNRHRPRAGRPVPRCVRRHIMASQPQASSAAWMMRRASSSHAGSGARAAYIPSVERDLRRISCRGDPGRVEQCLHAEVWTPVDMSGVDAVSVVCAPHSWWTGSADW